MAKADILSQLYAPSRKDSNFDFNALVAPPLLSLVSIEDIKYLNYLASSPRFASKLDYKYSEIKKVMNNRGFRKLHAGTNRVVYVNDDLPNIVIKICTNSISLTDAPNEYRNQFYLAPFNQKVFEYSPCGTVGLFERVDPITSREEFLSIADSVYELLTKKILGNFVMEDIGSKYFMNWGIRRLGGFGPVLLDFPSLFVLDGKKLFCNKINPLTGIPCRGEIDYDAGFNHLYCKCCGKHYQARQLADYEKDNSIIIARNKGDRKMEIVIKRGKETVTQNNSKASKVLNQNKTKNTLGVEIVKEEVPNIAMPQQPITTSQEEMEKNTLKVLFAKYPEVGAQIIQNSMYTIKKSDVDAKPDQINIGGLTYIRSDLAVHECHCHDTEEVKEEEDDIDYSRFTPVTEKDFDENGKFILEKEEEPEQESTVVDAREDYVNDDEEPVTYNDKKAFIESKY